MEKRNLDAKEVYVTKEHHGVDKDNTIVVKNETLWDKIKKKIKPKKIK